MNPREQIQKAEKALRATVSAAAQQFAFATGVTLTEIRVAFIEIGTHADPNQSLVGPIHIEWRIR